MSTAAEMVSAFEDRLVPRVLDGRVVPFVGAGISVGARIPGNPDFLPSVSWMEERLGAELRDRCKELAAPLKQQLEQFTSKSPKLDQAADLLTWLAGASHLCKVLQIHAFAQLTPQPAHRFLGYFAREGLITEIITTNYDTCIEQAFRASFGDSSDYVGTSRASDALSVVFNLAHYRAHAGRSRTAYGDPVLHLYKINGDAADYETAVAEYEHNRDPQRLEQRAARIILTERQLQTFRDEMWARDLYADRVRSRSLLFCGFGSDEPQVRHHAMLLMEEMQRQSHPVKEWNDIPKLPNAPFFAVYEPYLAFNQLQVLTGFTVAHARLGMPTDGTTALRIAHSNAFVGAFAEVLESSPASKWGPRLQADLFFEKLFQAVWLRRVKEELQVGRVFHGWLRSLVIEHRAWANWLMERIGATSRAPTTLDSDEQKCATRWALFGIAEQFFGRTNLPTNFMEFVHAAQTGGTQLSQGSDYYLSLREDPLFILLLLLFLVWLTGARGQEKISFGYLGAEPGLGLRIPVYSSAGVTRVVYLVKEGVRENVSRWAAQIPDQVWLIEIPGNERVVPTYAPPVIADSWVQPLSLRPVTLLRRTAAAVVRVACTPEADPVEVLSRVFATNFHQEAL